MAFFAILLIGTLIAAAAGRLSLPSLADRAAQMRWGMAAALVVFGADHLLTPERYLPMLPPVLPWPEAIVLFTGLCELAGAIGLLLPQTRRLAGMMLAIYFVCVFPANIRNAVAGLAVEGLPQAAWYYWARLLFQPLAVWWALRASGWLGGRTARAGDRPPPHPGGRFHPEAG